MFRIFEKPKKIKVTFMCDKDLVDQVHALAKGKTLTESLTIALVEWVNRFVITDLCKKVKKKPLKIKKVKRAR